MPKNYVVGNWKMNKNSQEVLSFFKEVGKNGNAQNCWVAPQSIHLVSALSHTHLKVGAQNCSNQDYGAFTGENSPAALKEMGAHFVIIGHSERRSYYAETNQFINQKVMAALRNNLLPILCIGETLEEREAGKTLSVVLEQLRGGLKDIELNQAEQILVAYEPVWAIGTGKTATAQQAEEVHKEIRVELAKLYPKLASEIAILYGGSVKPDNFAELLSMPNINGGLVGGASLKPQDYLALCDIATK